MNYELRIRRNKDDADVIEIFTPKSKSTNFILWSVFHSDALSRELLVKLEDGGEAELQFNEISVT